MKFFFIFPLFITLIPSIVQARCDMKNCMELRICLEQPENRNDIKGKKYFEDHCAIPSFPAPMKLSPKSGRSALASESKDKKRDD